jgi:hypothetical protein
MYQYGAWPAIKSRYDACIILRDPYIPCYALSRAKGSRSLSTMPLRFLGKAVTTDRFFLEAFKFTQYQKFYPIKDKEQPLPLESLTP